MKGAPINVLIVDNRPLIRAGMAAMLKAPDIRLVGEASGANETLRLVSKRKPTLVLLGGRISAADSIGLLRRMKKKWPELGVIMVTMNEDPRTVSGALALGSSGYLLKTVRGAQLLKAVRAAARGECVLEPPRLRKILNELLNQEATHKAGSSEQLTATERDVLRLITEGWTNRQIARRLGYSLGTVKDYVQKIIQKLEVSDRTQAAVKAVRLGLVE